MSRKSNPSKENYCYRILKEYSLIVDFDVEPDLDYSIPVPKVVSGETYGGWKERVLGCHVSNVVLYTPSEPHNRTLVSTLQNQAGADHLEKIFKAINTAGKIRAEAAINIAVEETERKYTKFSKNILAGLIADSDEVLEPSVKAFFDRYLKNADPDIDIEKIIVDLLKSYNEAVHMYRVKNVTRPS